MCVSCRVGRISYPDEFGRFLAHLSYDPTHESWVPAKDLVGSFQWIIGELVRVFIQGQKNERRDEESDCENDRNNPTRIEGLKILFYALRLVPRW